MLADTVRYTFTGKGTRVLLPVENIQWCWEEGRRMRQEALQAGRRDIAGYGPQDEGKALGAQAFGVMGEMAAAAALGIRFEPKRGVYRTQADLYDCIDVRSASRRNYGMRVRRRDKDGSYGVFVLLHEVPQLRGPKDGNYLPGYAIVVGWYVLGEAKRRQKWLSDHGLAGKETAWVVPQAELRDIGALRTILLERGSVEDIGHLWRTIPA